MKAQTLEKNFKKSLHPDIKDLIDISISNYSEENEIGKVTLLYDFEEKFELGKQMYKDITWFCSNPKSKFSEATHSNNPNILLLAVLSKENGARTLKEINENYNEFHDIVKFAIDIRNQNC